MPRSRSRGSRRERAGVIGLAVLLDLALWVGLWLFLRTYGPFETPVENLPSIDLTFTDAELPVVSASEPTGTRPDQPTALAQSDSAPVRESRRLAPPGPSQKEQPLPAPIANTLHAPSDTPVPPSGLTPSENLPLVEGTEEVLPDLPIEGQSAIATLGSPVAAYLDGVRRAVRRGWRPSTVYGRNDPSATDNSVSGRTEVKVRLRADGSLDDASVLIPSGMAALDNEAVAAFARAEPFLPVPAELVDARGGFSFRFSLQLDLARARFLRAATTLLRQAWITPPTRGPVRSKVRVAVVLVLVKLDGALAETSLEIPTDLDEVNRTALDLIARVKRFPAPPESLRVEGDVAQFRAAIVLRPRGSDELRVFSRSR